MTTLTAQQELDQLHGRSARYLADALADIQVARLRGDYERQEKLTAKLGVDLGKLLSAADLLGRRRMVLEVRALGGSLEQPERAPDETRVSFAATPRIPFAEAVDSILARYPVVAPGWEATRDAWARAGFSLARSTSETVTEKVQKTFVRFLRAGQDTEDSIQAIMRTLRQDDSSITRAYADTVFRTVTTSAYTEGRKAQAKLPGVRMVTCGWRYSATLDSDVRKNHKAGEGFVAHVDDEVWHTHSPPQGWQCRCALEPVLTEEMVQLGLADEYGSMLKSQRAPSGFRADYGFQARTT